MSYSAPGGVTSKLRELSYELLNTEISIAVGDVIATPKILAEWKFSQGTSLDAQIKNVLFQALLAAGIRDAGAGNITLAVGRSNDGITWLTSTNSNYTGAAFTSVGARATNFALTATEDYYAILAYNSNGATSGRIRNIQTLLTPLVPPGYTLTRLV